MKDSRNQRHERSILPDARVNPQVPSVAYEAVRAAWKAGCVAGDVTYPPLRRALETFAREGRNAPVSVAELLKALDALLDYRAGGDPSLDWDSVRQWAGGVVIHSYYRDD